MDRRQNRQARAGCGPFSHGSRQRARGPASALLACALSQLYHTWVPLWCHVRDICVLYRAYDKHSETALDRLGVCWLR